MLLRPLTFHSPQTALEAAKLQASLQGDSRILAGGTFLMNTLKLMKRKGTKTPNHVISLRKVKDLQGMSIEGQQLIIRSMTIIRDLFDAPLLTGNTQILRTVCRNISTEPIRNMATIGGNLTCRYTWTEMGAVMIALNATMHFIAADGKYEQVAAEDFFKNAARTDKIFSHVSIPILSEAKVAYRRVKKSPNVDIPLLSLCIQTEIKNGLLQNVRAGINNCVAFAQHDATLEAFLNGKPAQAELGEEALQHLDTQIYDTRSDDYKKHIFRVCLKDAINELCGKST